MPILLNRRQILASLLGIGALLAIPSPVLEASKLLIDGSGSVSTTTRGSST
jgi:hypothetical protein